MVQKWFLDAATESEFVELVSSFDPCSVSCLLNKMVAALNQKMKNALNKVAPLKVKKKSCEKIITMDRQYYPRVEEVL